MSVHAQPTTPPKHPLELLFSALNPLPALLQARCAVIGCKAINHLLALEPLVAAHLQPHGGRVVLLRWEAMPLSGALPTALTPPAPLSAISAPAGEQAFTIHCTNDVCTLAACVESNPSKIDVTISILSGIVSAAPEERLRFVRLEGDVLLAQDLSKVAKELRWDAEHDLARVVGNVPAYWIVHNAKKAAALLHSAVEAFKAKLAGAPL